MGCFHGRAISDCGPCNLIETVRLLTGEHLGHDAAVVTLVADLHDRLDKAELANVAAKAAIAYTLRRVQTDVDFFYVMNLTEAQARLCTAYAALSGEPLAEIEEAVNFPKFPKGRDVATIEQLRRRLAELER
jgi:hypothetical protein